MLKWFRRKRTEQAPAEVAAPEPTPVVEETPADQAGDEQQKRRRRRGTRGGRGRSRSTQQRPEAQPERKETPPARKREPKPKPEAAEERRPERRRGPDRRRRTAPERKPLPPAKRELLISVGVSEQRAAVLEDGRVAEVYVERPERRSIAGNIYKGKVDNVLPGMEAAFVEIGLEKNGFLYVDEIVAPELEGRRHGKKIQDLLSRGQEILVQAVKDPMKSKGARLTTEISLPGRFCVYTPSGEGFGVSRRLDDAERARLRDILKSIDLPKGGVIVRTAAEGASAEDIERDLQFLRRLWEAIDKKAKAAPTPSCVYQEAELPLRVVRDLFTDDFVRAVVDHERTYKRVVGYLKKTSPHMVERLERYKQKTPLFEADGVDQEIRSTLSRRVDLPSGGYLVFDYAEAFTVIDVNTGRFTGSRSKTSTQRLEDTITKNNLEAVKEVVRQLRLRDIGGIIVIDFIDMANPKNREAVEEALRTELARDRTKTYVVEISPLGLVEMTRQNVTDGPREILTKKCPTCAGDGIVVSEATAAVDVERRMREVATGSRVQAFCVEVNEAVLAALVGSGAQRLEAIEAETRRRFYLKPRADVALDHFEVTKRGKREALAPSGPVAEGAEVKVKLVEVGRYDADAGVGKLDGGYPVEVAGAAKLVGKQVRVRVERLVDGQAFATLVQPAPPAAQEPITAESLAEKPTRARAPKAPAPAVEPEAEPVAETVEEEEQPAEEKPKRKTRRGSRGGRRRRKPTTTADGAASAEAETPAAEEATSPDNGRAAVESLPRIHVPADDLGQAEDEAAADGATTDAVAAAEGDGAAAEQKPKRKTRRGSRGGRRRRKPSAAAAGEAPPEQQASG